MTRSRTTLHLQEWRPGFISHDQPSRLPYRWANVFRGERCSDQPGRGHFIGADIRRVVALLTVKIGDSVPEWKDYRFAHAPPTRRQSVNLVIVHDQWVVGRDFDLRFTELAVKQRGRVAIDLVGQARMELQTGTRCAVEKESLDT